MWPSWAALNLIAQLAQLKQPPHPNPFSQGLVFLGTQLEDWTMRLQCEPCLQVGKKAKTKTNLLVFFEERESKAQN